MKVFIALCLVAAAYGASLPQVPTYPENQLNRGRIVNGQNANINDHPWQLRLFTTLWSCGAVIITTTRAATAAHCVDGGTAGLQIRAGHAALNPTTCTGGCQTRPINALTIHPSWTGTGMLPNDVATIRWAQALGTGAGVQAATMAASRGDSGHPVWAGTDCRISGWGLTNTSPNITPTTLQWTATTVITQASCRSHWNTAIGNPHICIHNGSSSACMGDSGGPLSCRTGGLQPFQLVGLTSFGNGQCTPAIAQVYASVPFYRNWILANI